MPEECQDKLAFETEKEATAAKITAGWQHGNQELIVYYCGKCNLFHLATDYTPPED